MLILLKILVNNTTYSTKNNLILIILHYLFSCRYYCFLKEQIFHRTILCVAINMLIKTIFLIINMCFTQKLQALSS